MSKNKIVSLEDALNKIEDGMTIMVSGFTNVGSPNKFIVSLVEKGIKDINLIANDAGNNYTHGIGTLISNHCCKSLTASHIGLNPEAGSQMNCGELAVTLIPQGTLAERIRCGGTGLGGVLTPTGLGTIVEEGKTIIKVQGKSYILETPLRADIAIIKAWKADKFGNLIYRRTARNFNPLMAMAADFVIAEVEEIVEVGELDPDTVITPGICIDMIVKL